MFRTIAGSSALWAGFLLMASSSSSTMAFISTPKAAIQKPTAFARVSIDNKFSVKSSYLEMSSESEAESTSEFDFDVAIIGCGVGGHGAALHSRAQSFKTAVFAGGDVGGTCVNRGCVPSKALLAASGRVRDMRDASHLSELGIEVEGKVNYSREGIAAHAKNLANRVKGNLENSLVALGCDVIEGRGVLTGNPHEIKDEKTGKVYTAKVRFKKQCLTTIQEIKFFHVT